MSHAKSGTQRLRWRKGFQPPLLSSNLTHSSINIYPMSILDWTPKLRARGMLMSDTPTLH